MVLDGAKSEQRAADGAVVGEGNPPCEGGGPDPMPRAPALVSWLTGPRVVTASGRVQSWHNAGHPGFPYVEAAALWLSWAAWRQELLLETPPAQQVERVARTLRAELAPSGAVGRDGSAYLFDTCLVLHALVRAERAAGQRATQRLRLDGVQRFLDLDQPVLPAPAEQPRWSRRWGGHLVRAAALLYQAGEWLEHPQACELARRIRARAQLGAPSRPRYVHALAYRIEGELLFTALGEPPADTDPMAMADELAVLQRPDGLFPAWSDDRGGPRCDASAQAVRIWSALSPQRYAASIQRALAGLSRQQAPDGGMLYEPGGHDQNTWTTIFTDQALAWAVGGADLLAWV